MSKRKETRDIEEQLYKLTKAKRLYGCSEVTIGFYNNGHGDEIVDFCTMDSKGIIKCYEIKVTLSDFKSKAKLSWYGHYNYLVVTEELLKQLDDELLNEYIPKYVGIAIPCYHSWSDGIQIVRRAKKQDLSIEDEIMIKESLVRSLSYKVIKFRNANNLEQMSKLQSLLTKQNNKIKDITKKYQDLQYDLMLFENYFYKYYGLDLCIEDFINDYKSFKKEFPEEIILTLNDRGKHHNDQVKEIIANS